MGCNVGEPVPRVLRDLKIDDVSSVDVGAGRGVRVVLKKRDVTEPVEDYLKREVSQDERERLADKGQALPDGSFPIANVGDLKNAIRAIGRAKDPAKAKAHIKRRASSLGQSDLIPDTWKRFSKADAWLIGETNSLRKVSKAAKDFDEAVSGMDAADVASDLMCCVRDAVCALDCAFQSICADDEVADKKAAIQESYDQFEQYIDDLDLPDSPDTEEGDTSKRDDDMTTAVSPAVQAMIDKAVAEAVGKAAGESAATIAKLNEDLAVAKMSKDQKDYFNSLSEDKKKHFASMSSDEMDKEMSKALKRAEEDPVVKGLQAQIADLQKRLQASDDEKDLKIAKQDARELGLTQADAGEVLMKMRRGDKESIRKYEEYVSILAKSKAAIERTSKVFAEFGRAPSTEGTGATATDAIMAKAQELRQKDPNLTEAQAFDKAYNDPANRELRDREATERMMKIHNMRVA